MLYVYLKLVGNPYMYGSNFLVCHTDTTGVQLQFPFKSGSWFLKQA